MCIRDRYKRRAARTSENHLAKPGASTHAPPGAVAQIWKLRFARSMARMWTSVICSSFAWHLPVPVRHHTTPLEGGIHPISSLRHRTRARAGSTSAASRIADKAGLVIFLAISSSSSCSNSAALPRLDGKERTSAKPQPVQWPARPRNGACRRLHGNTWDGNELGEPFDRVGHA